MKCKRCGMEVEKNEIHIFNGGEARRLSIETASRCKTSLCGKPVDELFYEPITFEEAKKWR